jgi:hypothetical protein
MPKTLRGVYHNLRESKYTISNSEVVFFFSSPPYLDKFMRDYQTHRVEFNRKIDKIVNDTPLNMDVLADINLYETYEKRGFYVTLKGVEISCDELHQYALRKMTEKNSPNWSKIQKPKLHERIKSMELI